MRRSPRRHHAPRFAAPPTWSRSRRRSATRKGRVVRGLTTRDFEVRDNGELRPVLSLRSDRQSPLSVAIVVDMSGSMGVGSKIEMTRKAYESVLGQLCQDDDEAAVFTFDAALYQRCAFTRDLGDAEGGARRVRTVRQDLAL